MIRGWEKTLPMFGRISMRDMNGMRETVLRGNDFKDAEQMKGVERIIEKYRQDKGHADHKIKVSH